MPIHDLGYRGWNGQRSSEATRWWVITGTGIRLAWKMRLLQRFVLLAWLPAVYMGVAFFLYEQSAIHPEMRQQAIGFFRNMAGQQGMAFVQATDLVDPAEARHQIWGWLLLTFFRHPQGVLMALVVGLIAPPLISQDVRSRAFLLYFSRPITRAEYVLGKLAVVCAYVSFITTAPALALYVFGVLLSPDLSVLQYTWDLPLRIVAASLLLMVPTTTLALAFSSLSTRSYYAGFAWFAFWAGGFITYSFLQGTLPGRFDDRWALLSRHHTLGRVQSWVFDLGVTFSSVLPFLLVLVGLSALSVGTVFWRVAACTRG